MNNYTTVDEYIFACPEEHQALLFSIRDYIKSISPEDIIEVISYGMPTFKGTKNLIHFALNKSHIGIYPGSDAISFFKNDLKDYKTTKGAIHLPLDKTIPQQLLKKIYLYNIKKYYN